MKPLNASQARIFRVRINVAKAEIGRMRDDLTRLARLGVECPRMIAIRDALARARAGLEDANDACHGVEDDNEWRDGSGPPVTRLRFTPR